MVRPDFREFQMNSYYLSHGGPGSGRYPLGSGERPYQGKGRQKSFKVKKNLRRLNNAATAYTYYSKIAKRRLDLEKIKYPKYEKRHERHDKYRKEYADRYSKKFDEYLKAFKDAGVDLYIRDALQRFDVPHGYFEWAGKEFYVKDEKSSKK